VNTRIARLAGALAIAAAAVAGCGTPAELSSAHAPEVSRAQDFVAMDSAQAARTADRVALVVARGSRVVEGAPGTPFTRTRFAVRQVLKGSLAREFTIQVIGGRLGDEFVTSPVQAFRRGARYILFLGPDNRVGPTIFPQAVLEVTHAGDADVVEPKPGGLHLRGPPRLDTVLEAIRDVTGGSP
jgi:hypothetical protein